MNKRKYIIGYNDKIHLIGVDGEPWEIPLKEAKEHKRQLDEVIIEREAVIDDE